jgi:predicted dehydrogenase
MTDSKTPSAAVSTRRDFLATSAATATGLSALRAPAANLLGANETLNIGVIGAGGRARRLMKSLAEIPDVRIAAICDIYEVHLDMARELADGQAFVTNAFPELLDRRDIDAVLIGSPDHWHVPMTVAACEAGKHVYVEKPLTHNLDEGLAVIDAQNRHRRVVQVGTQQRSMPHLIKARERVQSGRLGTIRKVHLTWNRNQARGKGTPQIDPAKFNWKAFLGNAPDQPFDPYKAVGNWRWFWDFGGGLITDLMVHWIDAVHWMLNLDHPEKATTIGSHFTSEGVWETPDTVQTVLLYPEGIQVYFEGTFCNARHGAMTEIMGSDATLYFDRGRYELHPERGQGDYEELVLGEGKRGADFYTNPDGERLHLIDWIDAVRAGRRPSAPAEAGVSAAASAHLANLALRRGEVVNWADIHRTNR